MNLLLFFHSPVLGQAEWKKKSTQFSQTPASQFSRLLITFTIHKLQLSALFRNDKQSAVAIARSLDHCVDDVALQNYEVLIKSLVNEHMRRRIIQVIVSKSKRFSDWLVANSREVLHELHRNLSLGVIFDILQNTQMTKLFLLTGQMTVLKSGKLIVAGVFMRFLSQNI